MTGRNVKRRARIGVTLLAALCTARLGIAQEPPAGQTPPPAAPVVAPSSPAPVPAQAPQSPAAPPSSDAHDQRTSRISDDSVPTLDVEHYPARPRPIVELGPHFLGNGNIARSFRLPTGAVWLPQLIVFGTYSTALQGVRSPVSGKWTSEWSNRLDLFTNLQLSGTERLLVGFRPLDNRDGASGYNFTPGVLDRGDHHLNAELHSLFFEGDFGEIFPLLDRTDRRRLDIGFSIGRQQFAFEDGILINDDAVDAVGVTRNTVLPRGGSNLQLTGLFGWGSIEGSNGLRRERSQLFGLLTTADIGQSSFNGELFVVRDRAGANDGLYWALSRVRRIGALNTTFRALGSVRAPRRGAARRRRHGTPAVQRSVVHAAVVDRPGVFQCVLVDWRLYVRVARAGYRRSARPRRHPVRVAGFRALSRSALQPRRRRGGRSARVSEVLRRQRTAAGDRRARRTPESGADAGNVGGRRRPLSAGVRAAHGAPVRRVRQVNPAQRPVGWPATGNAARVLIFSEGLRPSDSPTRALACRTHRTGEGAARLGRVASLAALARIGLRPIAPLMR